MSNEWTTFVHPHKAYRLEYPAEWEHLEKDDARSCGFGPRDRDDVGLWITILPFSLDTLRIAEKLPAVFKQALGANRCANVRRDATLLHYGLKADMIEPREAGNFWIAAGGDLLLFASSQVPGAERAVWNPQFERLMSSLTITREEELRLRRVGDEVMQRLRNAYPEQNYVWEEAGIRGRDHVVYLDNVLREIQSSPARQSEIIGRFVAGLNPAMGARLGHESWTEAMANLLPVLKPRGYVQDDGPTRRMVWRKWILDVIITYAIKGENLRFVTDWDLERWDVDLEILHEQAMTNLTQLPWPERFEGSREPSGGRLIIVATNDNFEASRLLHPDLHSLLSGPLGSPFLVGIPDRDTFVACSVDPLLQRRIARKIKEDYLTSARQITPRLFVVTPEGVAAAEASDTEEWAN